MSAEEWIKICELRKSEESCSEAGTTVPSHVTYSVNNRASEKTILANGGVYEKTMDVDGCRIKRYWITVADTKWKYKAGKEFYDDHCGN